MSKRSYYRAANAIFGKIGRYASQDVTVQLINVKCVPILMYGLEACPLAKSDLSSLDFVINRFLWNYLGQIILMLLNAANTISGSTSLVQYG